MSIYLPQVNRSGISNLTGLAGAANIQGEDQKKLDVVSNTVFCNALRASGRTVGLSRMFWLGIFWEACKDRKKLDVGSHNVFCNALCASGR